MLHHSLLTCLIFFDCMSLCKCKLNKDHWNTLLNNTTNRKMYVTNILILLTHFMPLVSFCIPWKHQKTSGFLMFSGGIERYQWHEMDVASIPQNGQTYLNNSSAVNHLTHFITLVSFYDSWKYQKNQLFSDIFREYRKRPVA